MTAGREGGEDRRRTLGELVHAHAWSEVEEDFERLYPGDGDWVVQHARVFHTLRTLRARLSEMDIVIDDIEDDDGGLWVDISGRTGDEQVAIEFVDWAEWLGMVIDGATCERYTPTEILSHCVWEMSFFGFDEETIRERWSEIEVLASRVETPRRNRRS